ncbi:MAG: FkbM family methyltransferase [Chloroflexi bacterium]|nr:FkbM family methyltransferase [Chloroflexota bacterium]
MSKRRSNQPTTQSGTPPPTRLLVNGYVSIKQCRHGLFMYNLNDLYVGRSMDIYGEWCDTELACLGQILKSDDVVIDVGANIGTHTVFFSKKVESGMVCAFEPQRITYEFLCANLALNGLVNVLPIQAGAGDRPGETLIPVLNPLIAQNFGNLKLEGHSAGELVKVLPLDALDLKRCNLIKIDVEGMELKVLNGAEKTIRNCRPFLFVEYNGSSEFFPMLFESGYNCWWHISNYYNPNNFFHNTDNVWEDLYPAVNILCAPREIDINVSGFEPVINIADTCELALARIGIIKT